MHNRTQGLRPYRGSYLPAGSQVSGAMAAAIPAQSANPSSPEADKRMGKGGFCKGPKRGPTEYLSPCTQGLGWSRVAGPKNKNPRDPITGPGGLLNYLGSKFL